MGDTRGAYRYLVERPGGKRPVERSRLKREDNIKMITKKWDGEVWTGLIWLRLGTDGCML
jgi:hypothetical protein